MPLIENLDEIVTCDSGCCGNYGEDLSETPVADVVRCQVVDLLPPPAPRSWCVPLPAGSPRCAIDSSCRWPKRLLTHELQGITDTSASRTSATPFSCLHGGPSY
jgi:hypothetical protein